MPRSLEAILAALPHEELQAMHKSAQEDVERVQADLTRARVELDLIERALSKRVRSEHRTGGTRTGDTREAVLQAMENGPLTTSPAQIVAAIHATGNSIKKGTIRAMIGRLVEDGQIVRVGEGKYQLASRDGSSAEPHVEPTENEATEPLSTATEPQEAE